jgi:thiol:disulfide interchange protein
MTTTLKNNSTTVYLLVVALGFAFLLAELVIMGHTNGPRLISVVACVLGILFALAGLAMSNARRIIAILFVVLALSGVFGFMAHGGARGFRQQNTAAAIQAASADKDLQRALRSYSGMPPTLAPLMLSGLSLLGALVMLSGVGERKTN